MINDYMLDKVLDKIKEIIGTGKFGDTKILIDTADKMPDDTTLRNTVILITCVIRDDGKFHPLIFLEEAVLVAYKISGYITIVNMTSYK